MLPIADFPLGQRGAKMNAETKSFVAFAGGEIIARGALAEVALLGKARFKLYILWSEFT